MRLLLVPIAAVAIAAALFLGIRLAGEPGEGTPPPTASSRPTAVVTAPARTLEDVLVRARPDESGRVALSVTSDELTAVANDELPSDAPVERLELDVRSGDDVRPRVDFRADVRDSDLEVTGEVALGIEDGRVVPELLDVRAGVLPLPGPLRVPVQDVVDDAASLFAELERLGVDIGSLATADGRLDIVGQVEPGADLPPARPRLDAPRPADTGR